MTFFLAVLGGLFGTALGWIAAAAAAMIIGAAVGMSDFEGQRSMTAVFFFGPMGGLAGLIIGVMLVLRARRRRTG